MLFFPPATDLADPGAAVTMGMDGLLLGNALMPSAIEQEQRSQQAQRLQLIMMEQQLHQQQQHQFPMPMPSALLPMLNPSAAVDEQRLKANIGHGNALLLNLEAVASQNGQGGLLIPQPLHASPSPNAPSMVAPESLQNLLAPPADRLAQMAMPPTGPCGLCRLPILDKSFLLIDSQSWHLDCVRCAVCGQNLEALGATCFAKDGFLFCRRDYLMKFGKRCERCAMAVERGQMVMRVPRGSAAENALFHVHCFTCICCGQLLTPGEQYTVGPAEQPGGPLFCRAHFHLNPTNCHSTGPFPPSQFQPIGCAGTIEEGRFLMELNPTGAIPMHEQQQQQQLLPTHGQSPSTAPSTGFTQQMEANKENPAMLAEPHLAQSVSPIGGGSAIEDFGCAMGNGGPESNGGCSVGGSQKQKRMRTSFKHNQLRTMKAYFQLNHNPDAKDLKQLAQKTGLTKRVLQVWFQNARAKFRRNQHHKLGGLCGSALLEASSVGTSASGHLLIPSLGPGGIATAGGGGYQPNGNQNLLGHPGMAIGMEANNSSCQPISAVGQQKSHSLSPLEGAGSSLGGSSSMSMNAGGSSADEQGSENSFQ